MVVICVNCKKFWYENKKRCTCHGTTFSPTDDSNKIRIAWIVTDPDNYQLGRQIDEFHFEFKQLDEGCFGIGEKLPSLKEALCLPDYYWQSDTINPYLYTEEQLEEFVSPYYNSLSVLREIYGDESSWIIAECIFEQTL